MCLLRRLRRPSLPPGLLLLMAICLFLFADQNLMAPNLTQIGDEFGFTPEQRDVLLAGRIALVFWLLGGTVSIAVGVLTDRLPRKGLLTAVVLIGELPCLLTGFARSYDELFWLRALTGIGIGGALPLVFSLLGDLFPARERTRAVAWVSVAMGLGIGGGQLLSGLIGPTWGWRVPFVLVAAPNLVLGLVFLARFREPARGATEEALQSVLEGGARYRRRLGWSDFRRIFSIRSNVLVFLQGIPGTVPWGVFLVYLNDYLAQDKGFTVQTATWVVAFMGIASLVGGLLGGLIGERLYRRHPRWLPLLCASTTLAGVVPTAALLAYPSSPGDAPSVVPALLLGAATGLLAAMTGPNVRAMLIDVNAPETRGSVFALYNLADDLGKGFGPAIIALLIVAFGRTRAFSIANLAWVLCALFLLMMVRTFPADEAALSARLRSEADRLATEGDG